MVHARLVLLVTGILLSIPNLASSESKPAGTSVDYTRDIRPILSDSCYACHGPDEESREAELRLDLQESALGEGSSGDFILLPGNPAESELYKRISSVDEEEVMPPIDSGKSLTPSQIALVRTWIEQGAPWKEHWAFVAPEKSELPSVKNPDWPNNSIDYFIQEKVEQQGWQPAPEAEREILLRRVTFDLTGLPPTLAEIEDFLADQTSGAYERVVDRLLQSPHYGEHMARYWLDGARYGDTHGLHFDNYREMWLYRDWVVKAFNENKPYDEFVIEQLAGDLLPNPTVDQQVATGFCRCHVTTNEGGSIEEEVYVRNVVDRVSTTGTVFMGLTLGCAVCHDHKFDPISQKEFYQFFAFFNSLDGPSLDGNVKDPAPIVSVPDEEQLASLEALRETIAATRAKREERLQSELPEFASWLAQRRQDFQQSGTNPPLEVSEGLVLHVNFEDGVGGQVENKANPEQVAVVHGSPRWVDGLAGQGLDFTTHSYLDFGNAADFQDDQQFSYGAWVRVKPQLNGAIIAKVDIAGMFKGYDLSVNNGVVSARITRRRPGYSIKVSTKKSVLQPDRWHHVLVTYDGSKLAGGVVIYIDGERQPIDVLADSLKHKGGIRHSKPLLIGRRDTEAEFAGGQMDDVRIYNRRLSDADVLAIYLGSQLAPVFSTSHENITEEQLRMLRQLYLVRNDPAYIQYTDSLDTLASEHRQELSQVPTTLIFRERKNIRDAFVLLRGEYDQHGEKVSRQTLDCLPPMEGEMSKDRLGLAQWIVADEHPLTSRVAVNRFWQQLFGIGLVETSEDFGSQGSPPSHPELLDWLAVEFRDRGWDVKALMKQLVMSATYCQSSHANSELTQRDPQNRLLARGPRFRLDAEMLRDQALAVSGLLVDDIGGPGVKPPQPKGLWHAVGFTNSNTANFVADTKPAEIHRRSLYTFHKRTAPPPEMSTFDAPSRESTCVRRERTNTPLQALLLLNDPQYFEAARALAERALKESGNTAAVRAAYMVRLSTGRHASEDTVAELVELYEDQLRIYQQNESEAQALLESVGEQPGPDLDSNELAAWTIVANLILNLDEVVNKN